MTHDLETTRGRLLTFGTRASTVTLACGLVATFVAPGHRVTHLLLTAGLGVLLLTPVARVVASVVGYVLQRDWPFVVYTGIVLVLLIGSFLAAFHR